MAIQQLEAMAKEKGERVGIAEGKKHVAWYINGMSGAALTRNKIMMATTQDEIKNIFKSVKFKERVLCVKKSQSYLKMKKYAISLN